MVENSGQSAQVQPGVVPRPLSEIQTISAAIQQALNFDSMRDAIGFVCMWEEYRRTGTSVGEPCFGAVVGELLGAYGIDIDKFRKA